MNRLFTTTLLLLHLSIAFTQSNNKTTFFQTNSKAHLYYVELDNTEAIVYQMGSYFDKAGTGSSIRMIDTLYKQATGNYTGKSTSIITENNKTWLITQHKKTRKYELNKVADLAEAYTHLNNAYYLGRYFALSDELNKSYPLNHFTFRGGFNAWEALENKNIDPTEFRIYADARMHYIKDSFSVVHDRHVLLTNHLIQQLKTIDYAVLKDSLATLPANFRGTGWYFGSVVNEVSKQRPEFFFRLAADMPQHRSIIFSAAEENKRVVGNLKVVEGHASVKKEFFKDRRFGKTMPYKAAGIYALVGLIVLLISTQ